MLDQAQFVHYRHGFSPDNSASFSRPGSPAFATLQTDNDRDDIPFPPTPTLLCISRFSTWSSASDDMDSASVSLVYDADASDESTSESSGDSPMQEESSSHTCERSRKTWVDVEFNAPTYTCQGRACQDDTSDAPCRCTCTHLKEHWRCCKLEDRIVPPLSPPLSPSPRSSSLDEYQDSASELLSYKSLRPCRYQPQPFHHDASTTAPPTSRSRVATFTTPLHWPAQGDRDLHLPRGKVEEERRHTPGDRDSSESVDIAFERALSFASAYHGLDDERLRRLLESISQTHNM